MAVPLPENRTDRGDLGPALADSLVEAFLDRNILKIANESSADSRVECVILEYVRRPYTVDENENVQEYRVEIVAEVRFVDIRKNKTLWEEDDSRNGTRTISPKSAGSLRKPRSRASAKCFRK